MTSKYGKVRIYKIKRVSKDSKRWIQNATNLACENPSKKWGAAYDRRAEISPDASGFAVPFQEDDISVPSSKRMIPAFQRCKSQPKRSRPRTSSRSRPFRYDGSADWYCPGSYPPAVQWLIKKRKPFRQLEDFNSGPRDAESEAYRRPSGTRRDDARLG